MNLILSAFILFDQRCRCKEKISITQKRSEPRRFVYFKLYPEELYPIRAKTFQIKYNKKLSSLAKIVLNSFGQKYLYHAIDDIFDLFKSNLNEQKNLLTILYSPVLSLHNNFSINFFDIFIDQISINEVSKPNKFLKDDSYTFNSVNYITITLMYRLPVPIEKQEPLW